MQAGFFVFITGLMMTMFGVGGIENSITDPELALGTLVAVVGLLVMWSGTSLINKESE